MDKLSRTPVLDKLVDEGKLKLPTTIENEAQIGQYYLDQDGQYQIAWRKINVEPTLYRYKYIGSGLFDGSYDPERPHYVAFDLFECTLTGHRAADRNTRYNYTPDPDEYIYSPREFQALLRGDIDLPFYPKSESIRQRDA